VVDSIEGGDKYGLLDKYKQKIVPMNIPDSIFEAVHDGMQGVMEGGTGRGAKVEGIAICGKTGTVENYYRGVKQPNHSFFCAFAPRDNPKIAIMCVVENSGRYGGTYAAPISSLMIEKYLNDTINAKRKPLEERMINTNLIPPLMMQEIRKMDSLKTGRQNVNRLNNELRIIKDTLQAEDNPTDEEIRTEKKKGNNQPQKEKNTKTTGDILDADRQKTLKNNSKDSIRK
jgi:penicillin-binding protein 2